MLTIKLYSLKHSNSYKIALFNKHKLIKLLGFYDKLRNKLSFNKLLINKYLSYGVKLSSKIRLLLYKSL